LIEELVYEVLRSVVPAVCIFPTVITEGTKLPAVVYAFIGGQSNPTFDTIGLNRYRVEISAYSDVYLDAVTLRNTIISALDGYKDSNIADINLIQRLDDFSHEAMTYRCLMEFYVLSAAV